MATVGFRGGWTVRELGSTSDMQAFFYCVRQAVPHLKDGSDQGLLTDRLYRRYLRANELEKASVLAKEIRGIMARMPSGSIDWETAGWISNATQLDISQTSVAEVFDRYLDSIPYLSKDAQYFENKFKIYRPVMTIISDLPRLHIDQDRPLSEYDSLAGDPIWLRP